MESHKFSIDPAQVADLRSRLADARWPEQSPGLLGEDAWARGVPMAEMKRVADYWRNDFDWATLESRLNSVPQFQAKIDGLPVHFVHVRSPHENATPLLITHGWPGSFAEFLDVIPALTRPTEHGGRPEDAFHVVIPSLPGFAFSGKPTEPGWGIIRTAGAWGQLMRELGYDSYVAQGGDLGAWITLTLAAMDPSVAGAQVNFLVTPPPEDASEMANLGHDDLDRLMRLRNFAAFGSGYMALQATRPTTLGYALADSAIGQLAWMYEKLHSWSDTTSGSTSLTLDQILTQVSLYWLTGSGASSAQFYFESADLLPTAPQPLGPPPPLQAPLGVSTYLQDPAPSVRSLAEKVFPTMIDWAEHAEGGHFAALEQPVAYVEDLRRFRGLIS